jgi:hypothetical protein
MFHTGAGLATSVIIAATLRLLQGELLMDRKAADLIADALHVETFDDYRIVPRYLAGLEEPTEILGIKVAAPIFCPPWPRTDSCHGGVVPHGWTRRRCRVNQRYWRVKAGLDHRQQHR